MSKREYTTLTGRERKKDVLLYHVRISFKPGEITPEQANQTGNDLTMRFTKGKQAFVVSTHDDKEHIHSCPCLCSRKFGAFQYFLMLKSFFVDIHSEEKNGENEPYPKI